MTMNWTRRSVMIGGAAVIAAGELRAMARVGNPFALGVASGEPSSEGVVLWTRLAPDPLAHASGMPPRRVPVRWEVSESETFHPIRAGTKLDPLLQAAHHVAPWVSTWDDHEVANNHVGDYDEHFGDPAAFRRRKAAAYQAYYENMPLRARSRPAGPSLTLYRTISWGALAEIEVIDDRQYRPPPPCRLPDAIRRHLDAEPLQPDCAERHLPRSMLGPVQERWLLDRLAAARSRWTILAQQTLMMPYRRTASGKPGDGRDDMYNTDIWDGVPANRTRILERMAAANTPNPLILSGDIHSFVAGDHAAPGDPKRLIASEFVGGSISSNNHAAYPDHPTAANPGFRFSNIATRGYARLDLTRDRATVTFRGVDDVKNAGSGARDLASFTVEAGRAGLQKGA